MIYSRDGATLVSGSSDTTIRFWDVGTGETLKVLKGHTSYVDALNYSPDGETLVSNGYDGTLRFWDVHTGELLKTFTAPFSGWSFAFSPDGATLAMSRGDNTIVLRDVQSGQIVKTLAGYTDDLLFNDLFARWSDTGEWESGW